MKESKRSMLTLVEQTVFHTNNAFTRALYVCECGVVKEINMRKVRELRTISCGCMKYSGNGSRTHGYSKHPLYKIWKGIKNRCYKKHDPAYPRYGANGVRMCVFWLKNPAEFVKWGINNGWKPGMEVDKDIIPKRLKIKANIYSPKRCSIVTRKENCGARKSNRRIKYKGETKNLEEWCSELGLHCAATHARLDKLNWPIEKALTTPTYKGLIIEYNGVKKNLTQWANELGIKIGTLSFRLKKGWGIEKAFYTSTQNTGKKK